MWFDIFGIIYGENPNDIPHKSQNFISHYQKKQKKNKMSYEYETESDTEDELDTIDEEHVEELKQQREQDENETNFHFWMAEQHLHMPIEHWYASNKNLDVLKSDKGKKIPNYRLEDLTNATEYYVNIYGGNKISVLAEMITYFK